jgi:dolichol-phosphate mannosyltransferase
MILSIIIPVYNEEKTIIQILEKISKNTQDKVKYEIIVIDDGSIDETKKLL